MRFGYFMAPFHPVGQNPTLALERDLDLIVALDRFGFDEVWVGEHHSAGFELIASPEVFIGVAAERTVMIGDRHFDIDGARANGVHAVGAGWGFGSVEELRAAGADAIAHAPIDLIELLLAEPAANR